jgi:hypothetical protein
MKKSIALLLVATAFLTSACRHEVKPQAKNFENIHNILLVDDTDKILLKGSDAGIVSELIGEALKNNGYTVCREPSQCPTVDAMAVVKVDEFHGDLNRSILWEVSRYQSGVLQYTIDINSKFDGSILYHRAKYYNKDGRTPRELATEEAKKIAEILPKAK